jgi:hypothetical protein
MNDKGDRDRTVEGSEGEESEGDCAYIYQVPLALRCAGLANGKVVGDPGGSPIPKLTGSNIRFNSKPNPVILPPFAFL